MLSGCGTVGMPEPSILTYRACKSRWPCLVGYKVITCISSKLVRRSHTSRAKAAQEAPEGDIAGSAQQRMPSVAEFIRTECPIPGYDGVWRERPILASLSAMCITLPMEQMVCPGCSRLSSVSEAALDRMILDGGQVGVTSATRSSKD